MLALCRAALGLLIFPFIGGGPSKEKDARLIAMLVFSDVAADPRVEREARALSAAGYRVAIAAPDFRKGVTPDWGPNVFFKFCPVVAAWDINRFPWIFSGHMLRTALEVAPLAYHCHDLWTVWIGAIAAKRQDSKLVVDFHEWFSENVSHTMRPHRGLRKLTYRALEKYALRRADVVITVCQSIADELKTMIRRDIELIRNIPSLACGSRTYPTIREQFHIPDGLFIILYQGGVGPTRNLGPIIKALTHMPDVALVISGPGIDSYGEEYRETAAKIGVEDRLYIGAPVPSADVIAAANGANAGIWSLDPVCKNFYYALPNKIFEYLAAGLPVLVANLPEVKREIIDRSLGYAFEHSDCASIAAAVSRLRKDNTIKMRVQIAKFEPDWSRLPKIYARFR